MAQSLHCKFKQTPTWLTLCMVGAQGTGSVAFNRFPRELPWPIRDLEVQPMAVVSTGAQVEETLLILTPKPGLELSDDCSIATL